MNSPFRHVGIFACLAFACLPAAAHATVNHSHAALADLTLEQLSDIVVTSVSRRDERLSDVASSVYVIGREDIRRSGATSLQEALRLAPNLQVARVNAADYAITARGGNSTTANKLLVLIDGRTVYSPLFSGVFWDAQAVMLADVERIEVISGPGASIWGANAVNGVINVITRAAADSAGSHAEAYAGNRERGAAVRYGAPLGQNGHFRVYGFASERDDTLRASGMPGRDRARHEQAGWRADWNNGNDRITLQADLYKGRIDQALSAREIDGANLLARLSRALGEGETFTVQAYLDRTERDVPQSYRERLDTFDIDFQHGLKPMGGHSLMWGGGFRHAQDHVTNGPFINFLPARRNLNHAHVFVQDQWSVSEQFSLSAGLKLEHNPYTGIEVMPDLRLSYKTGENALLWGALSRAVRAPSRLDRDIFTPAAGGNPAINGGPDFRSEIAYVAELGYRAQPVSGLSYAVTLFHHDYDRLRSLEPVPGGSVLANRIKGTTTGIEGWGSYQASSAWRLAAGFVLMDAERIRRAGGLDQRDMRALGNDADLNLQLRASYTPSERSEFDLIVRHVSALPDPEVPAYTAVDARIAWRLTRELELALLGQNLLDRRHAEWGTAGNRAEFGRQFALKLTWRQ